MSPGKVTVRHTRNKWVQNTQGIPAAEGIYDTKQPAVDEARALAKRYNATLKIYTRDGRLQDTVDYSKTDTEEPNVGVFGRFF